MGWSLVSLQSMGTRAWYEFTVLQLFAAVKLTSQTNRVVREEGWTTIICCQEDFTASYFLLKDFECQPSRFILMKCLSHLKQLVQSRCLSCSSNSNVGIRELPTELGQLSNLWQLDIEDLNVTNVPQEVRKEGTVLNTHHLWAFTFICHKSSFMSQFVIGYDVHL